MKNDDFGIRLDYCVDFLKVFGGRSIDTSGQEGLWQDDDCEDPLYDLVSSFHIACPSLCSKKRDEYLQCQKCR